MLQKLPIVVAAAMPIWKERKNKIGGHEKKRSNEKRKGVSVAVCVCDTDTTTTNRTVRTIRSNSAYVRFDRQFDQHKIELDSSRIVLKLNSNEHAI